MRTILTILTMLILSPIFAQKIGAVGGIQGKSQEPTYYLSDTIIEGGVWTWFSDPRAIYIQETGEVVVGALQRLTSSTGQRRLASYSSSKAVTLGPAGWNEGDNIDDHNLAVSVRLHSDTFFTAYSDHVSPTGLVYTRLSADTTIQSWQSASTAGTLATYAQLHVIGDTLVHIWRDVVTFDGRGVAQWVMRKSGDGGRNWTAKKLFFWDDAEPAYLISRTTDIDRVDFFVSDTHPGNPISDTNCDLFHFYMERDSFFSVDGAFITKDTVTTETLDTITAAHVFDADTTARNGWVWDVRASSVGGSNYPVLVYSTILNATDHDYRFAKWNGTAWESSFVCSSEGTIADVAGSYPTTEIAYSGGITILQDNVLFCSRKVGGNHELWKYRSGDNGQTWQGVRIIEGNGTDNKQCRPFVPVNLKPDSPVNCVWFSGYYDYFDLPYWNTTVRAGKF